MITQTWFGKILCALGVHQIVVAYRWDSGYGGGSASGGCVRCNKAFQWDV